MGLKDLDIKGQYFYNAIQKIWMGQFRTYYTI